MRKILAVLVVLCGCAASSTGAPVVLPGGPPLSMLNPAVTQATVRTTICVRGWTATVRPPTSYTEPLKLRQIAQRGYADRNPADYEEDHAVPLELGGSPIDPSNLWPEPHTFSSPDDRVETSTKSLVCAGKLDLATARARLWSLKVTHGL